MIVHVLPGDAAAAQLRETSVSGEFIICRECLIEGDVSGNDLESFWKSRAAFIDGTYGESNGEYDSKVRSEFERLLELARDAAEINLWFEHELFCQVNLWFTLFLLGEADVPLFRVMPPNGAGTELWKGFSVLNAIELEDCLRNRVPFSADDRRHGALLWETYRSGNHYELLKLGRYASPALPNLDPVCVAESQKERIPAHVIRETIDSGKTEFSDIFPEFQRRLGVYGFGDSQVKRILETI